MQKSLSVSMIKFMQPPLICIGVDIGMGMAWVFDSIDKYSATYKDFISILKMYTYRQSSYIPCNVHFWILTVAFVKFIRTGCTGTISRLTKGGMIHKSNITCVSKHYVR